MLHDADITADCVEGLCVQSALLLPQQPFLVRSCFFFFLQNNCLQSTHAKVYLKGSGQKRPN